MNSSLKNDLQDYLQGKNFFQELCSYFCPYYIGPNYSPSEEYDGVLLVSEGVLLRDDPALDIKKEAYAPFKDSDVYYGVNYDIAKLKNELPQDLGLSLDSFVDSIKPYLEKLGKENSDDNKSEIVGVLRSVDYAEFDKNDDSKSNPLWEKLSLTLSKSGASIDDIAVCRFFLRPGVFKGSCDKKTPDKLLDNFFVEIDKKEGLKWLKHVVETLKPKRIYFASQKLADIISKADKEMFGGGFKSYLEEKNILNDLDSTWDSDKLRLERILEGKKDKGQKRLELLTAELVKIEKRIRLGKFDEVRNDLSAVINNIAVIVGNHRKKVKTCGGGGKRKKVSDEKKNALQAERRERLEEARKKRWVKIREENPDDFEKVENLTRDAFWKVDHKCTEHYVLHCYRKDSGFVPELSLVMENQGEIIGHVMYAWWHIDSDDGRKIRMMTFGPISICPGYQCKGFGTKLLNHSMEIAKKMGAGCLLIRGDIKFFGKCGFIPAIERGIRYAKDPEATDLLCKELDEGFLDGITGTYSAPSLYSVDENDEAFKKYDAEFPQKEKLVLPEQLR